MVSESVVVQAAGVLMAALVVLGLLDTGHERRRRARAVQAVAGEPAQENVQAQPPAPQQLVPDGFLNGQPFRVDPLAQRALAVDARRLEQYLAQRMQGEEQHRRARIQAEEQARLLLNLRYLNMPPPADPRFQGLGDQMQEVLRRRVIQQEERLLMGGLYGGQQMPQVPGFPQLPGMPMMLGMQPETAEQVRQREEAAQITARAAALDLTRRREAEAKARELLVANLSADQRRDYEAHGWFLVHVGKRTYRIRNGHSHNVELLGGTGEVVRTLCAYPGGGVPDGDAMLAQKLMLETDEGEFLTVANHAARAVGVAAPRGPAGYQLGQLQQMMGDLRGAFFGQR